MIDILFEDDVLLAANKPAGLPVHKTPDDLRPHLQGQLEAQLGRPLVLFHRLDLETTGIVLFGKDPKINRAMTEKFRDREMKKVYWAVVDGRWLPEWKEIRSYILKARGGQWANVPKGRGGDAAHTNFKLLKASPEKSWIEASPLTGRTHQIRLHCLARQHAILGDRLYGKVHPQGIPMALHARQLSFAHPITGKPVTIEADAPSYWKEHWLRGL